MRDARGARALVARRYVRAGLPRYRAKLCLWKSCIGEEGGYRLPPIPPLSIDQEPERSSSWLFSCVTKV